MVVVTRRDFLRRSLAAGTVLAVPTASLSAVGANEAIRLGFIGCGGRGGSLMGRFSQIEGVRVAGLCDADGTRLQEAAERFPQAKTWTDLRRLLDDPEIDAVVIASSVHWHALATIWAVQAGKDVYCEKPMSHNHWEGRQAVAAVKKHHKICQHGTQQRSDPMQAEIQRFLHEEQALGKILAARVNRYGIRPPIGKRNTPLPIPDHIDHDLWLGPAQDGPIYRDNLQYDWHWDWNTGTGEMGNWGVHVLDDLRHNVLLDEVVLPRRVCGGGGRVAFDDAGQTPNVHFVFVDTGSIPVVIGLSNLPSEPGSEKRPPHPGPSSGYIAYCEGGRLEGQRGRAAAFDRNGTQIRQFSGTGGEGLHQRNFIDALRLRDPSILNSPFKEGGDTTSWCHVANIMVRAGNRFSRAEARRVPDGSGQWERLLDEMERLLTAHGIDIEGEAIRFSPLVEIDAATERFVGEHADAANAFLRREYRAPYVVPEIA
jgi:predicted dehydrogenase